PEASAGGWSRECRALSRSCTSSGPALARSQREACAMPGGTVEIGEIGRAHSARGPLRPYEATARAAGVPSSTTPASPAAPIRSLDGRAARADQAKGRESVAATSTNRESGLEAG